MEIDDKKRKIAIDIDDTIFDFVGGYTFFHNKTHKTNLKREDFKAYSFNYIMGGTMHEAVNSVKEFYSSHFFRKMEPFPNSVEVIKELKKENKLFIVTSRPLDMQKGTLEQISKYFPNVFSDIFFSSNHYTGAKNSGKTKAEICFERGAFLLIDDSLDYAKECLIKGIKTLLFDAPWNQNGEIKGITRVKSWKEVGELLK